MSRWDSTASPSVEDPQPVVSSATVAASTSGLTVTAAPVTRRRKGSASTGGHVGRGSSPGTVNGGAGAAPSSPVTTLVSSAATVDPLPDIDLRVRPGRPCVRCGIRPKKPGRGNRLCGVCLPVPRSDRPGRQRPYVPLPCPKCGGPKEPGPGRRMCVACAAIEREASKIRQRARHRMVTLCERCGVRPKGDGIGRKLCDPCRAEKHAPRKCIMCRERPPRAPLARYCELCAIQASVWERERKRAHARALRRDPVRRAREYALRRARKDRKRRASEPSLFLQPHPLVSAIDAAAAKVTSCEDGEAIGGHRVILERIGIDERILYSWRMGQRAKGVGFERVDAVLVALGLGWWEVYGDEHARRPLFTVTERRVLEEKVSRGRVVMPRRVATVNRVRVGDGGVDHGAIAQARAAFERGRPQTTGYPYGRAGRRVNVFLGDTCACGREVVALSRTGKVDVVA